MRVMVLVKATKDSEAGVMPSVQLLEEMGKFNEELIKAGMMLAGEGLHPSSKGARVKFFPVVEKAFPYLVTRQSILLAQVFQFGEAAPGDTRPVLAAPQASIMQALVQGFMNRQPIAYVLFAAGALILLLLGYVTWRCAVRVKRHAPVSPAASSRARVPAGSSAYSERENDSHMRCEPDAGGWSPVHACSPASMPESSGSSCRGSSARPRRPLPRPPRMAAPGDWGGREERLSDIPTQMRDPASFESRRPARGFP